MDIFYDSYHDAVRMSGAIWQWIAADGLLVLIAIYSITLICTAALAVYSRGLAKKISRLTRASHQQAKLIEELSNDIDAAARKSSTLQISESAESGYDAVDLVHLSQLRFELAQLKAELATRATGLNDHST
ncbi:MAG TPA: hypothetical protein VGF97_13060 [Rhizomicrobium sp.]|jgi:hypothetical protein